MIRTAGWVAFVLLSIAPVAGAAGGPDPVAAALDRDSFGPGRWSVGFTDTAVPAASRGSATVRDGSLIIETGDLPGATFDVGEVTFRAPHDLLLAEHRYLTVRAKATKGTVYYFRPLGRTAEGKECDLWYEAAATDDRQGTEWETATFSLPALAGETGTGAVALAGITLACATYSTEPGRLEVDFFGVHNGIVPPQRADRESDFRNSLDDDGNGLTDGEELAGVADPPKWVLAYYHPWFSGRETGWMGWQNRRVLSLDADTPQSEDPEAALHRPDNIVPGTLGKRDIAAPYYPLDFARYPHYEPAEPLDYGRYGGVERYDCADVNFVADQIRCAKRFGIDGFVVDVGGLGSFETQLATVYRAAEEVGGFSVAAVYDWYYAFANFGLMAPKTPEAMARDLFYLRHRFGDSPAQLRHQGRPVIFATFLSGMGVTLDHWQRAVALSARPEGPPVDGVLPGVAGTTVELDLGFAGRVTVPAGEKRPLLGAFSKVEFADASFRPVGRLRFGTPEMRPNLLSGWSFDEGVGDSTFVWASSETNTSRLRVPVPPETAYIELSGPHFTPGKMEYSVTLDGAEVAHGGSTDRMSSHACVIATTERSEPTETTADDRDYALILDTRTYGSAFDGWALYSEHAGPRDCEISAPVKLLGATALPGFDDRVIRNPGNHVGRDDSRYFRRSFESALGASPDFLSICTWSEWGEGTVIEPTVEFGYEYCEIALTYSLIYRGLLSCDAPPSEAMLTVQRYDPGGPNGVRLSCKRPVTVRLAALRGHYRVARGRWSSEVEAGHDGLTLRLRPGVTRIERVGGIAAR